MTTVRRALPQGRLLAHDLWLARHRRLVAFLWLHVVGLFAFGIIRGHDVLHAALEVVPIAFMAVVGSCDRLRRVLRASAVALGLVVASAVLVHLSGGKIEAHFHYFMVVTLLTLYQDWVPFIIAVGFVVVDHGLIAQLDPTSVYDHEAALRSPWKWAVIHGGFLLATCVANVIAWRLNEQQALEDALTKLPNRRQLNDRLGSAVARRRRGGPPLALLLIDLDDFKGVNDTLGHDAGDALLIEMSQRLLAALRPCDTAVRLGGDEFAVIADNLRSEGDAQVVGERILADLAVPMTIRGHQLRVEASIGYVVAGPESTPEELLRQADLALYTAKDRGKGCCQSFDPAMQRAVLERGRMECDLRQALARDELVVHYQPIVELDTGATVEIEALVRWNHPERGLVSPGDFIPMAEQSGLIVPIGAWVLRQACHQAASWDAAETGRPGPVVSVNLSARQLMSAGIVETVASTLAESGLAPDRLCLEITESVLMEDADQAAIALASLKTLGVQLAVDDFGTGYASLVYLRRLPVDRVKVDRSFVAGLGLNAEDVAIVSGVLGLARSLGLDAIAEGVETTGQLATLQEMGCRLGQGYHWSRPLPADQLGAWLESARLHAGRRPEPAGQPRPVEDAGPMGGGGRPWRVPAMS